MSAYISEQLDISYSVPVGLIQMLSGVTKKPQKEIWCELSDIANICANRLVKKKTQHHSWTSKQFPGTDIELRIDMKKQLNYKTKKDTFVCEIKFGRTKYEKFTQAEVNEYVTESILLGMNDVSE